LVSRSTARLSSRTVSRRQAFVEQQHAGTRRDTAGKRQALLLPAREHVRIIRLAVPQAHAAQRGPRLGQRRRTAQLAQAEEHVL